MKSLNFSTDIKEYAINGDEVNTLKINVNDANLQGRIDRMTGKLDKLLEELPDINKMTPEQLVEVDEKMKAMFDEAFNTNFSETVFKGVSVFTPLTNGKMLFEEVFEVFIPLIQADMNKIASEYANTVKDKYNKYLGESKQIKEAVFEDVANAEAETEEETDPEFAEFLAWKKAKENSSK